MKIFWPHRSDAKGFSIENLANKYREKIYGISSSKISNKLSDNKNLEFVREEKNYLELSHLSNKKGHWANRDFSEYRDVA